MWKKGMRLAVCMSVLSLGQGSVLDLLGMGGGWDPRNALKECIKDVSGDCAGALVKFADNSSAAGVAKLAMAYAEYSKFAKDCIGEFVNETCWDAENNKWKQGKCDVGEACYKEFSSLESACANVDGGICEGTFSFGVQGAYIWFNQPSCTPNACNNDDDMESLTKCLEHNTCKQLPGEIVTSCKADLGCYTESNLALILAYVGVWGALILLFGVLILIYHGYVTCGKSSRRLKSSAAVGGEQNALLDGLGLDVPLTGGSQVSAMFSPDGIGEGQNDYIVEGSPSILNTASINRSSLPGGVQDQAGDADGLDSELGQRPRFKLSTKFEKHIINGFKFRRQELRGAKGQSGWGTGSTAASSLVWRSLFYKTKGNLILKGVSGYIKPGMCVACIGAPDSGATTLLKVLAGRTTTGKITGEVLLDGYPPSTSMKKILAFIPKEDLNLPTLTVRETLEFSLNLRSPPELPDKLRRDRVNVVLSLLGLSHVADTVVGDQTLRGISGGEKRRVSLGVELVVGRSLLLASQPTNGLDSSAAFDVIKATRALSDTGLAAFMATISQPSPELLALFDTVCMISRGTCIYFGPTAEAQRFFFNVGFVCPPHKSVSDFLEEMTGDAEQFRRRDNSAESADGGEAGNGGSSASALDGGQANRTADVFVRRESVARQSLVAAFRQSDHYNSLGLAIWNELDHAALVRERTEYENEMAELRRGLDDGEDADGERSGLVPGWAIDDDGQLKFCGPSAYTTGFPKQFQYCLKRQIAIVLRSPTLRARVGRAIFQGTLIGTMFFQLELDQQGAQSRFGLMYLAISSVVFGAMASIPELFAQRMVYYAQRSAGYFRPSVYFTALLVVEIPELIFETFINSTMIYLLTGLRGGLFSWNFLYYWATVVSQGITAWLLCVNCIMASPSAVVAQAVTPTIIALWSLFCGYLVQRANMIEAVRWLNSFNPLTRALKGMVINEVDGLSYFCKPDQLWPPQDDPLLDGTNLNLTYRGNEYRSCPLSSGGGTLFQYGYNTGEMDKWTLLAQNLVFPVIFTAILMVIMHTIQYESDSSDSAGQLMEARKKEMRKKKTRIIKERNLNAAGVQDYALLESQLGGAALFDQAMEDSLKDPSIPQVSGCIEFNKLNYTVDIPAKGGKKATKKQLLHDICGYAEPGAIVALMGASGAGKSTLLDVLANKKTGGYIEAELLINGLPRGSDYPRFAGYVEQMDSHLPTHTVREAIEASALLRLPREVGAEQRQYIVNKVISQLGLGPFQHQLVGAPANAPGIPGVSPEVRKKTTIAVELAMDPALLFLDEPTTGLDSASALNVMQAVRQACAQKATMCTIHQPSAEVFALFDWILLLQAGGRVVYFGAVSGMSAYFSKHGFGDCPQDANLADFALVCSRKVIQDKCAADVWDGSEERKAVLDNAPRHRHARGERISGYTEPSPYTSPYAASFHTMFWALLRIQFRFYRRDLALLRMRCATALIFGFIIAVLFYDSKLDVAGAQARVALCFISITYIGYSSMLVIPMMVEQRPVHFREYTSNYYTLVPYFLAQTLSEIPFVCLQQFFYLIAFYPFVGLRTEPEYVARFCFGMLMLNLACSAFSSFIASICPNADAGVIINNISNSVFTLFCGFLLPYKAIPIVWKPLYYLSEFRYPLAFLVASEMQGRKFSCPEHKSAIPIYVAMGVENDPHKPAFPVGWGLPGHCVLNGTHILDDPECFRYFCPVTDADQLFKQYNFPTDEQGMWLSLSTMVIFYVVWRTLAFLALKNIQHIKR